MWCVMSELFEAVDVLVASGVPLPSAQERKRRVPRAC